MTTFKHHIASNNKTSQALKAILRNEMLRSCAFSSLTQQYSKRRNCHERNYVS